MIGFLSYDQPAGGGRAMSWSAGVCGHSSFNVVKLRGIFPGIPCIPKGTSAQWFSL